MNYKPVRNISLKKIDLFTYEEKKELDELCKKANIFFASHITSKARLGGILLVIKNKIESKGYSWSAFIIGKWGGIKGMSYTSIARYIEEYYEYGNFINELTKRGIILGEEALLKAWEEAKIDNQKMMEQENQILEDKLAKQAEQHFNFNFKRIPKKRKKSDIEKDAKNELKKINHGKESIFDEDDEDDENDENDEKLNNIYFVLATLLKSSFIRSPILSTFKIELSSLADNPLGCIKKIVEEILNTAKESGMELETIIEKLKKDANDQIILNQTILKQITTLDGTKLPAELSIGTPNYKTPDGKKTNKLSPVPALAPLPPLPPLPKELAESITPMDLDYFTEAESIPLPL